MSVYCAAASGPFLDVSIVNDLVCLGARHVVCTYLYIFWNHIAAGCPSMTNVLWSRNTGRVGNLVVSMQKNRKCWQLCGFYAN